MPLSEAQADVVQRLRAWSEVAVSRPAEIEARVLPLLAAQRSQPQPSQELLAHIYLLLAQCSFQRGDYSAMLGRSQEALRHSRAAALPLLEARALSNIGLVHQRTGDLLLAVSHFSQSLSMAEQHADLEGQCRALLNIALVYETLGEYSPALQLHEQVILLARACGHTAYLGAALTGRFEDLYHLGDDKRALVVGREALEYTQKHGLLSYERVSREVAAQVMLRAGRPRGAWTHVLRGLKLTAQTQTADQNTEALAHMEAAAGRVLLALGKLEMAQRYLMSSLGRAQGLALSNLQREVHEDLARLYEQRGDYVVAYRHLLHEKEIGRAMLGTQEQRHTQQLAVRAHLEAYTRARARAALGLLPATEWADELIEQERQGERHGQPEQPENRDPLTGMVRRDFFHERAQKALALMEAGEQLGLVFVSVDDFAGILTTWGAEVADAALKEVAHRLEEQVRSGDLIGRMSQDEFMVMLGHLAHADDLSFVTDKLLVALRKPLALRVAGESLDLNVTVSLGGVVAPHDGQRLETLYRHADLALRQVQKNGGGSALRFQAYMSAEEQQKRTLEFELRGAAQRGELSVYYQAQLGLQAEWGRPLTGYEALVRWNHPRLGLVSPAQFIPLAEETHLILEVGRWVLREACQQAANWGFNGRGLSMSVNVSALQFGQSDFVEMVQGILQETGLRGECLTLELTESMLYDDEIRAAQTLRELEALGILVALDDFGTGYSSLSMLQNLPFHVLKIDRSFLNDLHQASPRFARAWTLMEVLVKLAHNLQMKVVVEGIESEEQWDLLQELGCDTAQGYWLSRPLPPKQAELLL